MIEDPSIMVKCECGGEAIEVAHWANAEAPDDFCFAWWKQGFKHPMSWRERIRWCLNILRTGNPWEDNIIVNQDQAKQIADFINQELKNVNPNKKQSSTNPTSGSCQ